MKSSSGVEETSTSSRLPAHREADGGGDALDSVTWGRDCRAYRGSDTTADLRLSSSMIHVTKLNAVRGSVAITTRYERGMDSPQTDG